MKLFNVNINQEDTIQQIRQRLLYAILFLLSALGLPALIIAAIEAYILHQFSTILVYILFFIPITAVTIFRKQLKYKTIVYIVLGFGQLVAIGNIVIYGFGGAGIPILFSLFVLTTIFFNQKAGLLMILFSALSMGIIGFLYITHRIALDVSLDEISTNPISWLTALSVLVFLGALIVFSYGLIQAKMLQSIEISKLKADELKKTNTQLNNDIQERINTQLELKESEARFSSIIEQSGDAMFISDFDGNIITVNNMACKILGYERNELIKLNISEIDVNYSSNVDQKKFWNNLIPGKFQTLETRHKRKDGSLFFVEVRFGLYEFSNKKAILGFARDITERKMAIDTIKNSERMLIKVGEIANIGGWEINLENESKATWTKGTYDIIEIALEEAIPDANEHLSWFLPEYRQMIKKKMSDLIETKLPIRFEAMLKTKKGNLKWCLAIGEVIEENNKAVKLRGILQDITDRKQAEEEINQLNEELETNVIKRTVELENKSKDLIDNQKALLNIVEDLNDKSDELEQQALKLKLANKELEAFSYTVSHDLRAPLRAINGFSKFLVDDYAEIIGDEGKRLVKIIRDNVQNMDNLITDLLLLTKVSRNELNYSDINMETMVRQVFDDLSLPDEKEQFKFTVSHLPNIFADPTSIRQVWVNLISNAIKYSKPKINKDIIVDFQLHDNKIIYFVKDSGVGFNPAYKHKLFGIFQRLHKAGDFEGTGVGLAIVERIIHKHLGEVWADGEEGKGATFYFSIPKLKI